MQRNHLDEKLFRWADQCVGKYRNDKRADQVELPRRTPETEEKSMFALFASATVWIDAVSRKPRDPRRFWEIRRGGNTENSKRPLWPKSAYQLEWAHRGNWTNLPEFDQACSREGCWMSKIEKIASRGWSRECPKGVWTVKTTFEEVSGWVGKVEISLLEPNRRLRGEVGRFAERVEEAQNPVLGAQNRVWEGQIRSSGATWRPKPAKSTKTTKTDVSASAKVLKRPLWPKSAYQLEWAHRGNWTNMPEFDQACSRGWCWMSKIGKIASREMVSRVPKRRLDGQNHLRENFGVGRKGRNQPPGAKPQASWGGRQVRGKGRGSQNPVLEAQNRSGRVKSGRQEPRWRPKPAKSTKTDVSWPAKVRKNSKSGKSPYQLVRVHWGNLTISTFYVICASLHGRNAQNRPDWAWSRGDPKAPKSQKWSLRSSHRVRKCRQSRDPVTSSSQLSKAQPHGRDMVLELRNDGRIRRWPESSKQKQDLL